MRDQLPVARLFSCHNTLHAAQYTIIAVNDKNDIERVFDDYVTNSNHSHTQKAERTLNPCAVRRFSLKLDNYKRVLKFGLFLFSSHDFTSIAMIFLPCYCM